MRRFDSSGDSAVFLLTFMFILMAIASIVGEYMRTHTMQTKVEQQLFQAVNVALEAAMHDSFRQDFEGVIDTDTASDVFYSYLHYDMGLDDNLSAFSFDGNLMFRLESLSLDFVESPPSVSVSCTLKAPSLFTFFNTELVVPFNIHSKNARID